MASASNTKSIDVGSMFLMDLSIHESDLNDSSDATTIDNDNLVYPFYHNSLNKPPSTSTYQLESNLDYTQRNQPSTRSIEDNIIYDNHCDYLANSLDRLAYAIREDIDQRDESSARRSQRHQHARQRLTSVTVAEPHPPPELKEPLSLSSLSDDSYVASSGTSLSASLIASSDGDVEDRDSTATREDSGVLDMKDLDGQSNNAYELTSHNNDEAYDDFSQQQQIQQQEKPISADHTATNLIKRSPNCNNHNHYNNYYMMTSKNSHRPTNKQPTNGNRNRNHTIGTENNTNNNYKVQSKRSISASLPIQVPARQMKKDLNKLKLNMMNRDSAAGELDAPSNGGVEHGVDNVEMPARGERPIAIKSTSVAVDDVDEFLEQEYNENHHNHYPIDEFDDEHLRADENPMKLFASIQALAKSLHEDAELFGSLPPKRLLESPIRSLALA